MEFSTFVVVFYFLVVVINQFSFLAVLLVGLIVQLIYYLQLQWFVTKLTVTYMFKRVIFSRFTPKYIITMLYAIDVSDLPENAWHQALDVE